MGLDAIWFVGDEFMSRSFTEHFKRYRNANKEGHFTMIQFEVIDYATTRYSSSLREVIPRIINLTGKAIEDNKLLPLAIVFVLDMDVIKQLNLPNKPEYEELKMLMEHMLQKIHRLCMGYKENLPEKCTRQFSPQFIWIIPPTHKYFNDNDLRELFGEVLDDIIEDNTEYKYMCCLRLKKKWDEENGSFYLRNERRFTPEGYLHYWLGVDAAIKFWHRTLFDVLVKKQKKAKEGTNTPPMKHNPDKSVQSTVEKVEHKGNNSKKFYHNSHGRSQSYNRYKWHKSLQRSYHDSHRSSHSTRRLPPPPQRK